MHRAISGLCCSGFLFGRLLWQLCSQMNSTNSSLKLPASLPLSHVHLHVARHAYPELIPAYKIMAFDCSQMSTTRRSESNTNIPRTRAGKTVTLVLASYFFLHSFSFHFAPLRMFKINFSLPGSPFCSRSCGWTQHFSTCLPQPLTTPLQCSLALALRHQWACQACFSPQKCGP